MWMLLWKEWRQQRWFLLGGCLCGSIVPLWTLLLAAVDSGGWGAIVDTGWLTVLWGCPWFAAVLAIAATQADLGRGLSDFWLSRPVSPLRLFLVKYGVAAVGLVVCSGVVISLDLLTFHLHRGGLALAPLQAVALSLPLSLLVLGVTMLLVVLTRDATKAMLLATWFGVLSCGLPLLLGGPAWLNVVELASRATQAARFHRSAGELLRVVPDSLPLGTKALFVLSGTADYRGSRVLLAFGAVTLVPSLYCAWLAAWSVRVGWLWRPGQKAIAWAIGLSAAALFGVSMRQVGQDMVPVPSHKGRPLAASQRVLDAVPRVTHDWTATGPDAPVCADVEPGVSCYAGGLMFRATGPVPHSSRTLLPDDFFFSVYGLPYGEAGPAQAPASARLSRTHFHRATPPVRPGQEFSRGVLGCCARGDRLYIAYQYPVPEDSGPGAADSPFPAPRLVTVRFLVVDVADPATPRRLTELEVGRWEDYGGVGEMVDYGDVVYIAVGVRMPIISIAARDEPRVVATQAQYPGAQWRYGVGGGRLVAFAPREIVLLDLSQPTQPRQVFSGRLSERLSSRHDRIDAVVCGEDVLYVSTGAALYCASLVPRDRLGVPWEEFCRDNPLVPDGNPCSLVPQVVGCRPVTPLERLAGRPSGVWLATGWGMASPLLFHQGRLVEGAGGFGVLVYDVSDPARPRRIAHGDPGTIVTGIGIWDGLLCVQAGGGNLTFLRLPEGR